MTLRDTVCTMQKYDTVVIGGGFYGLRIAQFLYDELDQKRILVVEKEPRLMTRASYNNQARVHGGYHYPRSILTALRSTVNLPVFSQEYSEAIIKDFIKYYAVATHFSNVSARQFLRFYQRINAPIAPAPEALALFDPNLIEQVFRVEEYVFDANILRDILVRELGKRGVEVHTCEQVRSIEGKKDGIILITDRGTYAGAHVLNTTYSSINAINAVSGIPIIPLKHELTEMCLVELPNELQGMALTVMCGPFFSIMPFPDRGVHTLSHVRYTPHSEWHDGKEGTMRDAHSYLDTTGRVSHFPQMLADVKRFMPTLGAKISYTGDSLWEIKTVLPQSEKDDSRPILYKDDHGGIRNYTCIMGGKMDNIYDVFEELKHTYAKNT